jgi:hypothetical protein
MRLTLRLREKLRASADGVPEYELAQYANVDQKAVKVALQAMPDAYVDRWLRNPATNHWARVWAVVVPPEHCPPPDGKKGVFGANPTP